MPTSDKFYLAAIAGACTAIACCVLGDRAFKREERKLKESEVWENAARFRPNHSPMGAMAHVRRFGNRKHSTGNATPVDRVETSVEDGEPEIGD